MKFMLSLVAATALMVGVSFAEESPVEVTGAVTIDTAQAGALFDEGIPFVDVRKGSDFDAGRIPGAEHLDIKSNYTEDTLLSVLQDKANPVVIYCNGHSCMRSSDASSMAVEWGFTQVSYYRDGFPAWDAAGNPVE